MSTSTQQAPKRLVRCRYLRANNEQCTGEVLDPAAPVLLCGKHAGRLIEHVRETYNRYRREAGR